MQTSLKFILVAAAASVLGTVAAAPSMAQQRFAVPTTQYDESYQGPHGHYNSPSDFVRDVEGTPCGINCTRAAQQRWSHYTNGQ